MSNIYFAAKPAKELADIVLKKAYSWNNRLQANGYLEKVRMAWAAYHGAYYSDVGDGHKISFGGESGELVNLPVNHIRNLADHMLNMITATRPTMEARAANTDYKSLTQTILANGLLDYYMREKRLERYLKRAVEYAIVMGSGYVKLGWNATSGEQYEFNEETQTPIYEGDVEFFNLSPFDVFVDSTKESQQHDWVGCRTWRNRFDLVAKYPELESAILGLPSKTDADSLGLSSLGEEDTDDVAVYEFYHKRSESLPDGRYVLFSSQNTIYYDGPLPYRVMPIFRMSPSDILGTPYGYTSIFDLLPLQDVYNSLMSTVATNQNAHGVQNIIVPRGANISFSQLAGGLNIIEADTQNGKPEALNLTHTPAEIFKMIDMLQKQMETLSGVNSVTRGNPEKSLESGSALALVQSMAIQFMSGLQQSYVALIEDTGTALINILKDYAAVPRVAAIVGKHNRAYMKEFKGDDLNSINRVIVDVANPLSRTTAGRVQMAEQMLQMGVIKTPTQYFTILNTGKLDVMIENDQSELMLVKGENERMVAGEAVTAVAFDDHKLHIMEHKAVLADPDLRKDPKLVQLVLDHVSHHIDLLRTTDPELLGLLGQTPLQGQQPPPQQGGAAPTQGAAPSDQMQPPQAGMAGVQMGQEEISGAGIEGGQALPNLPHPPAPFDTNPTNPADVVM